MDERAAKIVSAVQHGLDPNIASALENGLDQRPRPSAVGDRDFPTRTLVVTSPPLPTVGVNLEGTGGAKAWDPVWDYRGKDVDNTDTGDFAGFVAFIGPVEAPPTKMLRFGLADGLESSGVLEFLDINFDNPDAATDKALTDLQQSARTILCNAVADQRRNLPAGTSLEPNQIYLKPVLDAYIKLLSACKEVECIEMPLAWASLFRAEDIFPKVSMDNKENMELLANHMVRWGKDPGGEERSMMLE